MKIDNYRAVPTINQFSGGPIWVIQKRIFGRLWVYVGRATSELEATSMIKHLCRQPIYGGGQS